MILFLPSCPVAMQASSTFNAPLQQKPQHPTMQIARLRRTTCISSIVDTDVAQQYAQPGPSALQRYFETFPWRGYSINYRADGPEDGMPVLIVHGFGASINHWRKNIPALVTTGRLRVYTIDLLGFGGSDKASPKHVTYGIELWRDLLCDFADAKNPTDKWCFVGNSIGSLTSLAAAALMGEARVRACALVNSAGGLVSFRYEELAFLQKIALRLFNGLAFNSITGPYLFENFRKREAVANVLKQVYINQDAISDELLDILCEPSMDEGACEVFLAILNADAGPKPEDLLAQLQWCPMLIMWGEKDPWTPLRTGFHPGIKFPEYHNGIDLQIIPGAGHCVHDEYPEKVNHLLVPFLLSPKLKTQDINGA